MRDLKIGMHTLKILSWLTYHAYQDQRVNTERYGEKPDMKTYITCKGSHKYARILVTAKTELE